MRHATKRSDREASTIVLANAAGIAISTKRERQFEARIDSVFVLEVEPNAVKGDRLHRALREVVLREAVDLIVYESSERHVDCGI